jgi:hypothetical protein
MSKLETITIDTPSGSNTMQIGSTNTATINIGASGDTINVPAGVTIANAGTATGFGGITDADYWYFSNNQSISATTATVVTGHWARQTAYGGAGGELGSGLTESSGVFSFPTTGIYYVRGWFRILRDGDSRYNNLSLQVTLDNGTYNDLSLGTGFIKQISGGNTTAIVDVDAMIDVTDTSNVKMRFSFNADGAITINGAAYSMTGLVAFRLGDT